MTTPAVNANPRLAALVAAGTSPWLDQIRRSLIETGELARMVEEHCLRGVTSNPAIFEKAILGSPDYDDQLRELAEQGADNRAIYRAIATTDVGLACDVLRGVYDTTNGLDGYVSLEVDPDLAFDTDKTMAQAREYWAELDRPNVMIKVPGTLEGVPAIEELTYEGINVNVTLLFSVEAYEQIAEAYIRGLERRHAEGLSLDVHSVASFFVSRVDSEVDKRLEALGRQDLAGRAALANARAAYVRFGELFHGDRFAPLAEAGAPVQRPLWASTGTKNPAYPDTLYVDQLVAPETVNTMPMATMLAVAERGEVPGETARIDPTPDLEALADAGIDMKDVTDTLLEQGVAAFVTPMEKLLAGIESKREAILTHRPMTFDSSLPEDAEAAVAEEVVRARSEDVARRIWAKDATLWGEPGTPELADRLGWLTSPETMRDRVAELEAFAEECAADGLTDAVVLGMGGSSLAPEVLRRSFGVAEGRLQLHVLDSTDAFAVLDVADRLDLDRTLFVVSTKSGGTLETRSQADLFWAAVPDGRHFVAVTDPGSSMEELARERGFRRTFLNDPDIGGRYSALSYFGLVPAALMGAPLRALLDGSSEAEQACSAADPGAGNSGLWLGAALGALAKEGRDKLTFVVDARIEAFGLWVEQLVAESTGKQGKGILPVADEPLGTPGDYGRDRVFVHLRDEEQPDKANATKVEALAREDHPVLMLNFRSPEDLGRVFFFAEFATAVAGWSLGLNAFDQPDVQEAKEQTRGVLDEGATSDEDAGDDALRALLADAAPPSYVALTAYVAPSDAFDEAIAELRAVIRDATKATTTFGYGPRYLHSTGQLHKGGPATGRFLQLVADAPRDADVPAAGFSFETLKHAQALGDLRTLRARGLPAERVRLDGDPAEAVRALTERVEGIL